MNTASDSPYRHFLAYFVPLALQSIAQSLTYPLVAMIASRGPGGPLNMAGMAQANAVFGVLWTLGMGLLTTGMVYGQTKAGFTRCVRINNGIILAASGIYLCLMVPPVSHWMFSGLLGLPASIERPATLAFVASLPLTVLFFLRSPYQIVLYNNRATGRAFGATLGRIGLTLALSPVFCVLNAVGPVWATVCMTLGVAVELIMTRYFALPFLGRLPAKPELPAHYVEMIVFTLTLSVGALFLSISGFMMGAFIARAPNPEHMLPVFYLALGIANPVAYGATRLQALVITSYGFSAKRNSQLVKFSFVMGLVLGFLPLIFVMPGLIEWYYLMLQKLQPDDMPLVRTTAWALVLFPLTMALRAYSEGKAAWFRKPVTVLTGQAVYLALVAVVAFFSLNLGVPGNLLGAISICLANLAAAGIVLFSLRWEHRGDLPMLPIEIEK